MTLNELKEQLQVSINNYLDKYDINIANDVEGIIDEVFDKAFFAPAP